MFDRTVHLSGVLMIDGGEIIFAIIAMFQISYILVACVLRK